MKRYLSRNEKMMKTTGLRTFNWGIPALVSRDGFQTCPKAGLCAAGCYARGGWYTNRPVVADAYHRRLELAQGPREKFVSTIMEELKALKVERLRIHDSGDFFDREYLGRWLEIVDRSPGVEFYTYTKQVLMLKQVAPRPNLSIIYSFGGKEDQYIDVSVDPHCIVFDSKEYLEDAGYMDVSDDDAPAAQGELRVGLVYHGLRSYKNTRWGDVFLPLQAPGRATSASPEPL